MCSQKKKPPRAMNFPGLAVVPPPPGYNTALCSSATLAVLHYKFKISPHPAESFSLSLISHPNQILAAFFRLPPQSKWRRLWSGLGTFSESRLQFTHLFIFKPWNLCLLLFFFCIRHCQICPGEESKTRNGWGALFVEAVGTFREGSVTVWVT